MVLPNPGVPAAARVSKGDGSGHFWPASVESLGEVALAPDLPVGLSFAHYAPGTNPAMETAQAGTGRLAQMTGGRLRTPEPAGVQPVTAD